MSLVQTLRIGDFCRTGSGGTPSRAALARYYEGGTIPWVKSGELREEIILETEERVTPAALEESSIKLVPRGAILLAMYGATVGRLALLGIEATTNQAVCHIVPDPQVADTRYLFHALSSQVPSIIGMGVGGAQPNISQGVVKNLRVRLPQLSEQRRIAAILDKADALRSKRREALAQLDRLAQSIFLKMFGDPITNPRDWNRVTFAQFFSDETSSCPKVQTSAYQADGRYPVIDQGQRAVAGFCDEESLLAPVLLPVTVFGDHTRIVKHIDFPFVIGADGAKVLRASSDINPRFATHLLGMLPLPDLGYSRHMKEVKRLSFISPPRSLQDDFERRLCEVDRMRRRFQESEAHSRMLFSAIQHRAFRGEL